MTSLYITNLGKICAPDFLAHMAEQEYDYRLEAAIQESGRRLGNCFQIRKQCLQPTNIDFSIKCSHFQYFTVNFSIFSHFISNVK